MAVVAFINGYGSYLALSLHMATSLAFPIVNAHRRSVNDHIVVGDRLRLLDIEHLRQRRVRVVHLLRRRHRVQRPESTMLTELARVSSRVIFEEISRRALANVVKGQYKRGLLRATLAVGGNLPFPATSNLQKQSSRLEFIVVVAISPTASSRFP